MKTYVPWTPRDLEILRANFATATSEEMRALLKGRHSARGIVTRAWREGLVKSTEHRARVGWQNVRWNTGRSRLPRAVPPAEAPKRVVKVPEAPRRLQLRQG